MHKLYCDKEELTVGQLFLLEICDNRKITEFWNNQLHCEFDISRLMKIATGAIPTPPLKLIYLLKDTVNPDMWFYTQKQYNDLNKNITTKKEYIDNWKESINFQTIKKMYDEKTLWKYCEEKYGADSFKNKYVIFLHLLKGRNELSTRLIKDLEPDFQIENWFIK